MTRLLSDLLQSSSTGTGKAVGSSTIRRYQSADHARIADICRNVYDGTDYMPRMIQHIAEQHGTRVLVSQTGPLSSDVDGIVCGQKRGCAFFLFGLRVAEEARGRGRARALMEAICQQCGEFGAVQIISSATTPQNTAAGSIFNRMGFHHTHTVDQWPSWDALAQYEQVVGWAGTGVCQNPQGLGQQANMVDVLGVRERLAQLSRAVGQLQTCDWVQCSGQEQLREAVTAIRTQQQLCRQQVLAAAALDSLPWVYETFPLDASWTKQRLAEGQVWLLSSSQLQDSVSGSVSSNGGSSTSISMDISTDMASSDSEGASLGNSLEVCAGDHKTLQQYAAVVVIHFSKEMRRWCAGIMTAEDAYIAATMEFVASQLPHCVYFFDRGNRHSSGKPDPDVVVPAAMDTTGTLPCFIVYARGSDQHLHPQSI